MPPCRRGSTKHDPRDGHAKLVGRRSAIPAKLVESIPAAARPLAVVVGALLALQSSQGLDPAKVAFLAVTTVAISGSVHATWRMRRSSLVDAARPWLIASLVVSAIVGGSLPVALANGTAVNSWLRDAAPYLLLAAAPWLAIDLGSSVSPRVATLAITIVGLLATLSFTITWLQRRGFVDLPVDRLVFPSFVLAMTLFALAVARSISGRSDRYAWAAVSGVVIAMLLETGTRTTLALMAIPVVLSLDAIRVRGPGFGRTALLPSAVPLLVVALLVFPGLLSALTARTQGPITGPPPSSVTGGATLSPTLDDGGRFGTLGAVVSGSDTSMGLRWAQYVSAWNVFVSSPVVGRGPGVAITWTDDGGNIVSTYTADTPLTVLAKFGLAGVIIWVVLGWASIQTLRRLRRAGGVLLDARSALLGLAVGLVALAPFGAQLEDKGTGLAIILVLGLALSAIRVADAEETPQSIDA